MNAADGGAAERAADRRADVRALNADAGQAAPAQRAAERNPQQRHDAERGVDARPKPSCLRLPATSEIALTTISTLNQNVIQRWRSASGSARCLYQAVRRSKPVWNQAS